MAGVARFRCPSSTSPNGFTLIEVLAALSLLAVGVLGSSALQQEVLRRNFAALTESRVQFLLQDLAERMRAGGADNAYLIRYEESTPTALNSCTEQVCNEDALARWNLSEWRGRVEDTTYVPAGEGQVSIDAASGLYTVAVRYGMEQRELTLRFEP